MATVTALQPPVQTATNVYALRPKLLKAHADSETRLLQTSVAVRLGLNEAIFLQQLNFRLRKPSHVVNGVAWYEASYATLRQVDFPFWSDKTIARTARRLERGEFIVARPMSRNKYDRTRWYTLNDAKLAEALGCTWGQSVPIDAPPCPPQDPDTLSPSLEEEKREKEDADFSAVLGREEETSQPPDPLPAAAAHTQDGSPEPAEPAEQTSSHSPATVTDHTPVADTQEQAGETAAKEETPTTAITETKTEGTATTQSPPVLPHRQHTCSHPLLEIVHLSEGIIVCNHCYALLDGAGEGYRHTPGWGDGAHGAVRCLFRGFTEPPCPRERADVRTFEQTFERPFGHATVLSEGPLHAR
jgi:hypothetical protein